MISKESDKFTAFPAELEKDCVTEFGLIIVITAKDMVIITEKIKFILKHTD